MVYPSPFGGNLMPQAKFHNSLQRLIRSKLLSGTASSKSQDRSIAWTFTKGCKAAMEIKSHKLAE
jgi:hypothetical protein